MTDASTEPTRDSERTFKVAIIRNDARRYWLATGGDVACVEREEHAHVYTGNLAYFMASEALHGRIIDHSVRAVILIEVEKFGDEWTRLPEQPWGAGI